MFFQFSKTCISHVLDKAILFIWQISTTGLFNKLYLQDINDKMAGFKIQRNSKKNKRKQLNIIKNCSTKDKKTF